MLKLRKIYRRCADVFTSSTSQPPNNDNVEYERSPFPLTDEQPVSEDNSIDEADSWLSNNNERQASLPDLYASEYNMSHKNRGQAIIFNHMTFEKSTLNRPREGSNFDIAVLSKTLENLGFEVSIYLDKSCAEIKEVIEETSKSVDHSDNDCILIAVMSHGDHGSIFARDKPYQLETLWSPFTADKCPSLAGKPKLFIIQACQGKQLDGGFKMVHSQTDGPSKNYYTIPKYADFLIAHSTMPGFYSWRQPSTGSWFIQALCKELNDNGNRYNIERLLTNVRRMVAFDSESKNIDPSKHGQKQIPATTSTLTRMLTFTEK